jgi:hypothetical protein
VPAYEQKSGRVPESKTVIPKICSGGATLGLCHFFAPGLALRIFFKGRGGGGVDYKT